MIGIVQHMAIKNATERAVRFISPFVFMQGMIEIRLQREQFVL